MATGSDEQVSNHDMRTAITRSTRSEAEEAAFEESVNMGFNSKLFDDAMNACRERDAYFGQITVLSLEKQALALENTKLAHALREAQQQVAELSAKLDARTAELEAAVYRASHPKSSPTLTTSMRHIAFSPSSAVGTRSPSRPDADRQMNKSASVSATSVGHSGSRSSLGGRDRPAAMSTPAASSPSAARGVRKDISFAIVDELIARNSLQRAKLSSPADVPPTPRFKDYSVGGRPGVAVSPSPIRRSSSTPIRSGSQTPSRPQTPSRLMPRSTPVS
eukprot:c5709_g1_i1.p1 GENE.c5709_g1_i1~~c5709_g1_i1.p1  ORF type:complete len:277 (+),score=20.19 c5709_g1_i1:149-979(+)